MRSKIIKISAVVLSIALLFGGLFLLLCDDVGELIQQEKIKPYVPDFTLLESTENSNPEEENDDKIPDKAEEKIQEKIRNLCGDFDNSVGWINVPETKIDFPVMYSGGR